MSTAPARPRAIIRLVPRLGGRCHLAHHSAPPLCPSYCRFFLLLFVVTLVAFRVNSTLLEASFYTDTLRKLDAYNCTYDAALPAALEDQEKVDTEDLGLGISLTHVGIVGYVKRVLSPEWLQENVEQVV